MFNGCECSFGGRSCRDFGLMLYDFGNSTQDSETSFASSGNPLTDHVPGRRDIFLYGVDQDKPLTYRLVLTAGDESIDRLDFFSRWEVSEVASWLCGHQTYQYLTIRQPDMQTFRFRCVITDLQLLTFGGVPWAFAATVTCDSPYAYTFPETVRYTASQEGTIVTYDNRSAVNGYFYPKLTFTMRGRNASVKNLSDQRRVFTFTDVPTVVRSITVDCQNQIITDDLTGMNLYPYCNLTFPRMVRGDNRLVLTGDFDLAITSEFPVDVGA